MGDWRFFEDNDLACSKFELVVLTSQRAYDLQSGALAEIEHDESDKSPIIALKELYSKTLDHEKLFRSAVKRVVHFSGSGYSGVSAGCGVAKLPAQALVESIDRELIKEKEPGNFVDTGFSFIEDEEGE
ncbi:DNA-directed RNA polymerase, omega subunit [Neorickettsia helminthoeca str. Oregon]|uniref:DNA-directed RNA polymerase subunit omega n=1 Tax=Neorickettsia helminthoeca str. Oregon TaxID=1286528 RepID=X5HIZ7_9RICK|nr:DNA-directed RNA polymerase subunit omega [Neorickettsia helminthoeca]AHX11014.1 DNA-directed RNA polymerase, omega subunit [Neorickettsia helminthoeca str. Oregon]